MRCIRTLILLCVTVPVLALAATESFQISTIVGNDTLPPTTPSIISAQPVSTSQINVTWGVSTDDFALGGYQVFRDALQIATTTLTTFSDTGLSASTTYTYEIRAFDTSFNYSSTSVAVATTTLPVVIPPVVTTTPEVGSNDAAVSGQRLVLQDVVVVPARTSATLSWQTSVHTGYQLRWGRSADYELGTVVSDILSREQITTITNLEPGTTYQYEVRIFTPGRERSVVKTGYFTTDYDMDVIAPSNVSDLVVSREDGVVVLRWDNPDDEDFAGVRVVRNYRFFPDDSYGGVLVYTGPAEQVVDRTLVDSAAAQYYGVFAYDIHGNVSSGAVVYLPRIPLLPDDISEPNHTDPFRAGTTTIDEITITDGLAAYTLTLNDVLLVQGQRRFTLDELEQSLHGSQPFTISIPYDRLPEHLKAIVVTMRHPIETDKRFQFLLRPNQRLTLYEATIAPLGFTGVMPLALEVYDFKTQTVGTLIGTVRVTGGSLTEYGTPWLRITVGVGLLLLLLGLYVRYRRLQ